MGTTLGEWLCIILPWHKYRGVRRIGAGQSELIQCTRCKREWAMNHDTRSVLPWHTVKHFYNELDAAIAKATGNP